jgi:hypothetical protein
VVPVSKKLTSQSEPKRMPRQIAEVESYPLAGGTMNVVKLAPRLGSDRRAQVVSLNVP